MWDLGKQRSELEILADILRVSKNGAKKSHIVCKANLNFKIVKGHLDILRNSGLIAGPNPIENVFSTTDKGTNYLRHFEAFKDYLKF